MSGCSVWHMYAPDHVRTGSWSFSRARLIGVQSAILPSAGVLKAVSWSVVRSIIVRSWKELAPALDIVGADNPLVSAVLDGGFLRKPLRME